jgi:hypothetical protein
MPAMTAAGESPTRAPRAPIVARRTDQLGGRLGAIVNALSIAKLLGTDFGFVWPRGPEPAVRDPSLLFSRSFLKSFEIPASELRDRTPLPHWELLAMSEADARRSVSDASDLFVEVHAPFDVLGASWESPDVAAQRFRDCWREIDWCDEVRRIVATCDELAERRRIAAVHIRAGDIVDGAWCQVVAHEKYLPTAFVENAVGRLAQAGDVLVLSDNADYLAWLAERFPAVLLAPDVIPGYAELTDVHQALAEICLLSRCDPIIGPPSSAFSRLAANLGPHRLVRADELAGSGSELELLRSSIADLRELAAESPWWRKLVARDICWCLDVFADAIPPGEQRELAAAAVELDPEFGAAAARLARIAALAGELPVADAASSDALRIAEPVTSFADPLIEALATDVAVRCFAAVEAPLPSAARTRLLSAVRMSDRWAREDADRTSIAIGALGRSVNRCLELEPLWSEKQRVEEDLCNLISTVQWLAAQPLPVRRRAARALAGARNGQPPGAGSVFAGLADHRSVAMYDPLRRDLDRMVVHLYDAVQAAAVISNGNS